MKRHNQQYAMIVNGLAIDVTRKRIKNCHLRVCPPHGDVRLTVPLSLRDEAVHSLVSSRLDWIKSKQEKFRDYVPVSPQNMQAGEIHYYLGQACALDIIPVRAAGSVVLSKASDADTFSLSMFVRDNSTAAYRKKILQAWYKEQMLTVIPPLLERWQAVMGVQVSDWGVKKMKSKWGSCHTHRKHIWLNLDLIKTSPACVEYVVVHELVHLLEPSHNKRFKSLMDNYLPNWRLLKTELNKTVPGN